ncbi:hypothetical protein N9J84_00690 [Porticoccaceae bacterium]|nr:hypothetical protein [Porticoccaceae bacterium]
MLSKTNQRKEGIRTLLKGIETGDAAAIAVVNPNQYIQHNPQTTEGGQGLVHLFRRLSKTSPKVNIVRIFSDGDFVFAHTEYDFSSRRIGFEVFRFEGDQTVEHWDNIQPRLGPNSPGHSMVSGPVEISEPQNTEINRQFVRGFVEEILIGRNIERLSRYFEGDRFIDHSPEAEDGLPALRRRLSATTVGGDFAVRYNKLHRVFAEGDFVLTVSEGTKQGIHSSFYDLFRVCNLKLDEHWDTTEAIPPEGQWKNNNGKF